MVSAFFAIENRLVFIFKLFFFCSILPISNRCVYIYVPIDFHAYIIYTHYHLLIHAIFYRKYNILTISKYGNTLDGNSRVDLLPISLEIRGDTVFNDLLNQISRSRDF